MVSARVVAFYPVVRVVALPIERSASHVVGRHGHVGAELQLVDQDFTFTHEVDVKLAFRPAPDRIVVSAVGNLEPLRLTGFVARLPGAGERVILVRVDQLQARSKTVRPLGPASGIVIPYFIHHVVVFVPYPELLPVVGQRSPVRTEYDGRYPVRLLEAARISGQNEILTRTENGPLGKIELYPPREAPPGHIHRARALVVEFEILQVVPVQGVVRILVRIIFGIGVVHDLVDDDIRIGIPGGEVVGRSAAGLGHSIPDFAAVRHSSHAPAVLLAP